MHFPSCPRRGSAAACLSSLRPTGNFSLFLSWHLRLPFSTGTSVHYFHTAAGQYWLLDCLSGCRCSRSSRDDSYCVCLNRYYLWFSCKPMLCPMGPTILHRQYSAQHSSQGTLGLGSFQMPEFCADAGDPQCFQYQRSYVSVHCSFIFSKLMFQVSSLMQIFPKWRYLKATLNFPPEILWYIHLFTDKVTNAGGKPGSCCRNPLA